ncbi:MAG: hypothetical protein K2X46_02330 [Roseomonas sp.]|nr:hypothetical protein [Roseomonas sp.]
MSPEVFGLTTHASTPATAARRGVEQAQRFCADRDRGFDIVRSEIWPNEYRIAFRCPRVIPDPVAEALVAPLVAPLDLPTAPEPPAAILRNRRGVPTSPGLF